MLNLLNLLKASMATSSRNSETNLPQYFYVFRDDLKKLINEKESEGEKMS